MTNAFKFWTIGVFIILFSAVVATTSATLFEPAGVLFGLLIGCLLGWILGRSSKK